jgi:hypothetical protein
MISIRKMIFTGWGTKFVTTITITKFRIPIIAQNLIFALVPGIEAPVFLWILDPASW